MDNSVEQKENIASQKPKKKRKDLKLFITLLCLAAVVAAGLIIHNISMEKWITEQYASLGIAQEEEASSLMQKTMREYYNKYKNLDTTNAAALQKALDKISKNYTIAFAKDFDLYLSDDASILNATITDNVLEITLGYPNNAFSNLHSYLLTNQMVAEVQKLMQAKNPLLLQYIDIIRSTHQLLNIQKLNYTSEFKSEFFNTAKFLKERGIETSWEYYKFLNVNDDEVTITYNDGEINTYFTIKPDKLRYNPETGEISFTYTAKGDAFFDDIAAQFLANQGKIIDLSPFLDAGTYSSN